VFGGVAPVPVPVVAPDLTQLNVIVPVQLSVAVAAGTLIGLPWQNDCAAGQVIVGGIGSSVHVTVLDTVEVLPHPSIAVKVLVTDLPQPVLCIAPSLDERVGAPHPSVAVAVPNEPVGFAGLHPKATVV